MLSIQMWCLFLIFSALSHAASMEEVALSKEWRRLLHWKTPWIGESRGGADGDGFYLSPTGQFDPLAELKASVAALERGGGNFGKLQQPIGCAFPARKDFLEKALGRKFPQDPCPHLQEFLGKLDPSSASLVFATAYPNNPASMFGHSFLKIQSKKNLFSKGQQLLDWSLNYSAMVPEDENAMAFTYFGLTGGYAGQFSLVPYYAKLEEYGYSEGRDIWEYQLALSSAELDRLLKAIWEIETNTHFQYYFFDENCSQLILLLLEVAKPEWDLSGYFLHVIPGETVRKVSQIPGAITAVHFRPSLERRLRAVADALNGTEWENFEEARASRQVKNLRGKALQAYLLFLQAEKKRKGSLWLKQDEVLFRDALLLSSQQEKGEEVQNFGGELSRPDLSHGAYRIGLGPFLEKGAAWKNGAELSVRFAYHDLLDPDPGYMPHSEILFPNFRLRYSSKSNRISLSNLELLSIVSLTPRGLVRKPLAWRAKVAYGNFIDADCESCKGLVLEGGAGAAFEIQPERFTVWSLLGGQGLWSSAFIHPLRAQPFFELGLLYTFRNQAKLLLESRVLRAVENKSGFKNNFHLGLSQPLSKDWSLRFLAHGSKRFDGSGFDRHELLFSAVRYF